MTVGQHTPRIEPIRAPLVTPDRLLTGVLVAALIAVIVLGAWLVYSMVTAAPGTTWTITPQWLQYELHHLRMTIPGGGFI